MRASNQRPATTGVFRYRLDLAPTLVTTGAVVLGIVAVFAPVPHAWLWLLAPVSFFARFPAPAHQHAHGHLEIFRARALNALYDHVLALAAGHTTAVWELQHTWGHHRDYLDTHGDVAGPDRFGFARRWPTLARRIAFMICADVMTIPDAWRLAAERPAQRLRLRRRLATQLAIHLGMYAALLAADPVAALAMFIVPNVILRWLVGWIAFGQHHGVPSTDTYTGSMNEFGFISRLLLNVGHHTAHHEKPTLHWSLLPARTAEIFERIPPVCVRGTPDAGWGSAMACPR